MPWRPSYPGERPTLGFDVMDWMQDNLSAPDRADYEPFVPTKEQAQFLLSFYEVNPTTGRRRYRRAVLSRSRGWGKSPFLAAIACAEALADVVPNGWDANGQPVGRPWADLRTPLVQVAAVSEFQTKNSWSPLREMLDGPAIANYPGLEVLDTFVNLPRGRIEPVTSSPRSIKGNRAVFAVLDQTEEWVRSNGGLHMADIMRTNAGKIGGSTVESPNAFTPGVESVAEQSAMYYKAILEGRTRDAGLLYDHREAPPDTDLFDRDSLVAGLRYAYGDSSDHPDGCVLHDPPCPPGWSSIDRLVAETWDLGKDPQVARADFLNQITHASDAWLSQPEWAGCSDAGKVVADREMVTLGFDGSLKRQTRGVVADATALVGCRVSDGHVFPVRVWEAPDGPAGLDWQVPTTEVDIAVRDAFRRFRVVGFYADPALWEGFVAQWEAAFHGQLAVKATREHPIEFWTNRERVMVQAVAQFHSAVVDREMTHDGSFVLARHVLNARRRAVRLGYTISKATKDSPRKIDAAVAAVLAWQARLDAVAAGVGQRQRVGALRRIR